MTKYVVAVFSSEAKVYEGIHALEELDEEGSITLYDTMVVKRDATGRMELLQPSSAGVVRTRIGALVRGLIGLFGGPVGTVIGATTGPFTGGGTALLLDEVSSELVDDISRQMTPGTIAVFAEVSEQWIASIDTRMHALAGKVMRESEKKLEHAFEVAQDALQAPPP